MCTDSSQVAQYRNLLKQTFEQEKQQEIILKQKLEADDKILLNTFNKLRDECVRLEQDIKTKESSLELLIRWTLVTKHNYSNII